MFLSPVSVLLFFRFSEQWILFVLAMMKQLTGTPEPLFAQTCLHLYAFIVILDVELAVPCFCVAVFSFFWAVDICSSLFFCL